MAISKITLHIIVEKDPETGWFTASCPALPGCATRAKTEDELIENTKEAVTLCLEVHDGKELNSLKEICVDSSNVRELTLEFSE